MSLEQLTQDLFSAEELSFQKILSELLKSDANLPMKTEIHDPLNLALLKVLAKMLRKKECEKSAEILENFIQAFLEYMVSYNRKSRTEIVEAIKHNLEEQQKNANELLKRY